MNVREPLTSTSKPVAYDAWGYRIREGRHVGPVRRVALTLQEVAESLGLPVHIVQQFTFTGQLRACRFADSVAVYLYEDVLKLARSLRDESPGRDEILFNAWGKHGGPRDLWTDKELAEQDERFSAERERELAAILGLEGGHDA